MKYLLNIIFHPYTLYKAIRYNFLSRKIVFQSQNNHNPIIKILPNTIIELRKNAKIILNSSCLIGYNQVKGSKKETRILIEENAQLIINDEFIFFAGSYIRIVPGGKLILNGGFVNENVQMTIGAEVSIGKDCAIARDVNIRSYDAHYIEEVGYQVSKSIKIGNHVWIGQGVTILKGVTIGDGAILAANALVTKDIPDKCLAAGCPAKVIKMGVNWHM